VLKKYTVKPPRDLTSKFEKKQAAKAKAEQEAEDAKRRAEEEQKNAVSSTWTSFWDMHFPQNMWFFLCVGHLSNSSIQQCFSLQTEFETY